VFSLCLKMAARTRHKSSSHMSNYVGTGKDLLLTELPTVRDLLRYGILQRELSEENKRNYIVGQLVKDMVEVLQDRWLRANAQLKYPVTNHPDTIFKKLKALWEEASKVSLGKGKLKDKNRFAEKLDKLVDILNCRCKIVLCSEYGCEIDCLKDAHIECECKRDEKIPVVELEFIRAQRDKVGSISTHQIGQADVPESRRQEETLKKQELKRQAEEKKAKKAADKEKLEEDKRQEAKSFINEGDPLPQQREPSEEEPINLVKQVYNTKDISNIALASMRHHTGLRETAEIATAAWIDAGLISAEDTHLVIDHNKLKRAQDKLVGKLQDEFENNLEKNGINCLLFDGRKDDTRVMLELEGRTLCCLQ
jgi:hypothetical protein